MKFCIDTCSLLTANHKYNMDTFPSIWQKIDAAITGGDILLCDFVIDELEKKNDQVYQRYKNKCNFPISANSTVLEIAKEITQKFPTLIDTTREDEQADPYLIALAENQSASIVTEEKAIGVGSQRVKIPNVCAKRNIDCCDFLAMMQKFGWTF